MLTQKDQELIDAFDGLHRRRHFFSALYLPAIPIILIWLLGLGNPFAVTVGPYVFFMVTDSNTYWVENPWMYSPIAAMAWWEAPCEATFIHYHCRATWPLSLRLCVNVMLLLPLATVFAVSLAWFVREFARAASEPSMDPPTLSRDAALAVAFGPALCVGAHALVLLIIMFSSGVVGSHYPLVALLGNAIGALYRYMPPVLHWPIWSVITLVMLRAFAHSRRGLLKPLRELFNVMLSLSLTVPVAFLMMSASIGGKTYIHDSPISAFVLFLCLLPLFWSLGAIIALAYRWPSLRCNVIGSYCVQCGYDMRGSFAVGHHECPECGKVNTPHDATPFGHARP